MINIIVVFPKPEIAKSNKSLLVRNGFHVAGVCTTGLSAVSQADGLMDGIVVCGYKLADMLYSQLRELLPKGFEMLLMAQGQYLNECLGNDIICLQMPVKAVELISTVRMMTENMERSRRKRKQMPKERSREDTEVIKDAKALLMVRNNMTEEEAHRYIQKSSMDSCTDMAETAQMILSMMNPS